MLRSAFLGLLVAVTTLLHAQPGLRPAGLRRIPMEVTDLRVSPEHPTDRDPLTIAFRAFVVSSCGYDHDVVRTPDGRFQDHIRLDLRFALPDSAECTADLPAMRTLTVRLPAQAAGHYQLRMPGYGLLSRTDFVSNGPAPAFTITPTNAAPGPIIRE